MTENENLTYLFNKRGAEAAKKGYDEIIEETKHPYEVSNKLLMQIVNDNKDTEYGKKYHFDQIKSYEDYAKNVPIITYDDVSDYIERMANGEQNVLTAYPFFHMTLTSGTVGKRKKIPMTNKLADVFMKYNKFYNDAFYSEMFNDEWMKGRLFCTSQGTSYDLPSGISVGDASSVMARKVTGGKQGLNEMLKILYTSPVEASIPDEGTDTKYLMVRFALEDKNIRGIVSGYSSLVNQYMDYIAKNYEMLINDIESGTINSNIGLPESARESLKSRIAPNPKRAEELREIFKNGSDFKWGKAVWPNLLFIYCVCTAAFSVYYENMKERFFDESVTWIMSGITASEGLFSIHCKPNCGDGVLATGATFMEFLPVDAGDDFSKIVPVEKVEVGKVYELIITNVSGYYRYRMEDCVQIVGYFNKTPLVRYMYRTSNCLNMNIEKTTEVALTTAVTNVSKRLGIPLEDYTVYGNQQVMPCRYDVLIQPYKEIKMDMAEVSKVVDEELCKANEEYWYCRKTKTIGEPVAYFLQPQTSFLYRDLQIMKGGSPSQIKPVHIIRTEEQHKFFYVLRDTDE